MKKNTFLSRGGACAVALLAGMGSLARAETVVTETAGTISDFRPDSMVIRTQTTAAPIRYVVRKDVQYVDDAGAPVSLEVVKSGLPVTVHYVREGDQVIARRVVVHRLVIPAPAVEERRTVIEQRPVIEEHRTTTTTTTTETR